MSQDFDPRSAEPGQRFGYTTATGDQRELAADSTGVVRPKTPEDVRALDTFDLPIALVATKSKRRSAKKAAAPEPAPATAPATPVREVPAIAETDGQADPAGGND